MSDFALQLPCKHSGDIVAGVPATLGIQEVHTQHRELQRQPCSNGARLLLHPSTYPASDQTNLQNVAVLCVRRMCSEQTRTASVALSCIERIL